VEVAFVTAQWLNRGQIQIHLKNWPLKRCDYDVSAGFNTKLRGLQPGSLDFLRTSVFRF